MLDLKLINVEDKETREAWEDAENFFEKHLKKGLKLYANYVAPNDDNGIDLGQGDVLRVVVIHDYRHNVELMPDLLKELRKLLETIGYLSGPEQLRLNGD